MNSKALASEHQSIQWRFEAGGAHPTTVPAGRVANHVHMHVGGFHYGRSNECRKGWDSNPRNSFPFTRFRIERLKPGSATLPSAGRTLKASLARGQFDFVGSVNNWQDRCWTSLTTSGLPAPVIDREDLLDKFVADLEMADWMAPDTEAGQLACLPGKALPDPNHDSVSGCPSRPFGWASDEAICLPR